MPLSHNGYLQAIHLWPLSISSYSNRFWGFWYASQSSLPPWAHSPKSRQMFPSWQGSTGLFWPTPWAVAVDYGLIIVSLKLLWGRFSCLLGGVSHILFIQKKEPTVYNFCSLSPFFLMILTLPPVTWALGIYRICGRIWNSSWCQDAFRKIDIFFFLRLINIQWLSQNNNSHSLLQCLCLCKIWISSVLKINWTIIGIILLSAFYYIIIF